MPYEIQLTNLPGGISVEAAKGGERARVQVAGVATSEDGEVLIRYLGFASGLLDQLRGTGHEFRCSQIDNFLAIIRRDRSATVYVNELHLVSTVRIGRACEAGEPIYKDDIIDITETRLGELTIPDDAGVICVLSQGWRKAVLFDFAAFAGDAAASRFQRRSNQSSRANWTDLPIESLIVQSINHRYGLHTLNPSYAPVDRRPALRPHPGDRCSRPAALKTIPLPPSGGIGNGWPPTPGIDRPQVASCRSSPVSR